MAELTFDRLPPVLAAFGKVALSRPNSRKSLIEPLIAVVPALRAKTSSLARYRRVCESPGAVELPVCYPQVMCLPLHMSLLGHADFPLAAMGLVHVSNQIEQRRALGVDETFAARVEIAQIDATDRGHEFDLVTEFRDDADAMVWRGVARILSRGKSSGGKKSPPPAAQPSSWPTLGEWRLKANLGRRYALASGDVNPIHLSGPSAKLLGFKRAIIHGMWTLARSAAALPVSSTSAGQLDVEFKTPLFLPGQASLHGQSNEQDSGTRFDFEVKDSRSHKPILLGAWTGA